MTTPGVRSPTSLLTSFTVLVIVGSLVFLLTRVHKMHVQLNCLRRDMVDLPPPLTKQAVGALVRDALRRREETAFDDEARVRGFIRRELDAAITATLETMPPGEEAVVAAEDPPPRADPPTDNDDDK